MRSQAEIEAQAEQNRRRLLEAEAAALLLLSRRQSDAVRRGLNANRSLGFTAGLVESAVRDGITDSRALSRSAGLSRLRAEAASIGYGFRGSAAMLSEHARDVARAGLYARNYAGLWLAKANGASGKPVAAVQVANVATKARLDTIGISESSEAFNTGRAKYLRENADVRLLKVWDAQLDKRTCPRCSQADGTIVFANERFPLGEPGSVHPRDRCVWSLIGSSERHTSRTVAPPPLAKSIPPPAPSSLPKVPAAPRAKLPAVANLGGGRLSVDDATKSWAKRLDSALGDIAKDGGAGARGELRTMLGRFGATSKDAARGAANVIKIGNDGDLGGMAGFHNWDGSLTLSKETVTHSRAALRKLQLGVDPGDRDALRLSTLIHEELHGCSAMTAKAYQSVGAALEEATTELAARRITSKIIGREVGAVYQDEINGLRAVVKRYTRASDSAIVTKIDDAVLGLKKATKTAESADDHVKAFVDKIKLTPKQKASVLKDLTETPWWKPEAQGKKSPLVEAAKPKTKKAVAAKPRGPPKKKLHPDLQKFLGSGFTGEIPQSGLRTESFKYLRAGGKSVDSMPVTFAVDADGRYRIIDGRHRLTLARERGDATIRAKVIGYGPRGGTRWTHVGDIKIQ